jgi:hypothetical protein
MLLRLLPPWLLLLCPVRRPLLLLLLLLLLLCRPAWAWQQLFQNLTRLPSWVVLLLSLPALNMHAIGCSLLPLIHTLLLPLFAQMNLLLLLPRLPVLLLLVVVPLLLLLLLLLLVFTAAMQ